MKVFGILGTKQTLLDKGQIILMTLFFFTGAVLKNIFLLVVFPVLVFSVTFFIRERIFGGKPEWWILVLRMIDGRGSFYCLQIKDRADGERNEKRF